jgi:hypothetical protein
MNISHTIHPEESLSFNDWITKIYTRNKIILNTEVKQLKMPRPLGYFYVERRISSFDTFLRDYTKK